MNAPLANVPKRRASTLVRLQKRIGLPDRPIPVAALIVCLLLVIAAIFGDTIAPYGAADPDFSASLAPPFWMQDGSTAHILGADQLGRDSLSRLIDGARISLITATSAILVAGTIGVFLGLIAGFFGGLLEPVIMRIVDAFLALPFILMALALVAALGSGLGNIVLVMILTNWARYARLVHSEALSIKERDFVTLARIAGVSRMRIAWRHIFPNAINSVSVLAILDFGRAIILESSLSFLGLGIQPPEVSWGSMLADGKSEMQFAWWLTVWPGLAILIAVLSFNSLGDWLKGELDPPEHAVRDVLDALPLLNVRGLNVSYDEIDRSVRAVADADLAIYPGEIVGVAGESGSGKTTLCTAMLRALPSSARIEGDVDFAGQSLFDLTEAEMRCLRGRDIAMILQNPMTSLDPLFTIGNQVKEVLQTHQPKLRGPGLRARALEQLRRVHITAPESRLRQYPHEMSGGMKQRILTAMATSSSPRLLIADEPTTALDVTVQEEILALFHELRERAGVAIVIITHDLDVIRRVCDRIVVMYAGRIVEDGPVDEVFCSPRHPYTKGLLDSLPRVENGTIVLSSISGQVRSLSELGPGCAFADRCPRAVQACTEALPPEVRLSPAHRAFCRQIKDAT